MYVHACIDLRWIFQKLVFITYFVYRVHIQMKSFKSDYLTVKQNQVEYYSSCSPVDLYLGCHVKCHFLMIELAELEQNYIANWDDRIKGICFCDWRLIVLCPVFAPLDQNVDHSGVGEPYRRVDIGLQHWRLRLVDVSAVQDFGTSALCLQIQR